jgi:16S rRNA processing protein RimM
MPKDTRILLGHIRGAHGIRGEVTLQSYTADPAAIADYGPLTDDIGQRTYRIAGLRSTGKGLVARLDGIGDRTAAEALRNTPLYVERDRLPPPTEGDYYHADLIGLRVVDRAGTDLGAVVAVQNFGAGDLLEVRYGGAKATEFVPFTDACVPVVDIASGRVVVVPPVMVDGDGPETDDAKRHADVPTGEPG